MKIGILTSGGDCPGLNAVIRGIGKCAYNSIKGVKLIGIPDGYGGLMRGESSMLAEGELCDILDLGGTILGTSRTPFKKLRSEEGRLELLADNYKKLGLDCLMTLGGAGTHKTAAALSGEGCNIIGLPKTIDNDIYGTDITFGFSTAVDIATECIDRVKTTAASHGRTMIVELMGNKAGWLTLYAGLAGGADMILIPELPYSLDSVCRFIEKRIKLGSCIIAVAEGALSIDEVKLKKSEREKGSVAERLAEHISQRLRVETRAVVPGHIQRGGAPSAYDRVLSTELGCYAAMLAKNGIFGVSVAIKDGQISYNKLADIAGKSKRVPVDCREVETAKSLGVSLGV